MEKKHPRNLTMRATNFAPQPPQPGPVVVNIAKSAKGDRLERSSRLDKFRKEF